MTFGKLINLGLKTELPFYDKREVRMVNLFAFITLFGLFIGITTLFFINGSYPLPIVVLTTLSSTVILLLNWKGYHNFATYVFVVSINCTVFLLSEQYKIEVGNYLYYFPIVFCVALLHNPFKANLRTMAFFAIILLSFLVTISINIETFKLKDITEADNKVLLIYNGILTVSITIILLILVVRLINQQNTELLQIIDKEKESQVLIHNSLKEKDVLLAEIQHRVKNNLAVMSGLLSLQLSNAQGDEAKILLLDAKNRVMSIAMVHERLYNKEDLSKINLGQYLLELTDEVVGSHNLHSEIKLLKQAVNIDISITKAIPIGLIVNEALTNSLKHAFAKKISEPQIALNMSFNNNIIKITIGDNGIGFGDLKKRMETSLGVSLIESLANQIDAEVAFSNNNGACVELSYSVN